MCSILAKLQFFITIPPKGLKERIIIEWNGKCINFCAPNFGSAIRISDNVCSLLSIISIYFLIVFLCLKKSLKEHLIKIFSVSLGLLQNKIHLQKSFEWSGLILWINEISLNYEYHKQLMDTLVGIAVSKQNWITPLVDSIIGLNEKAFVSNEVIPKHAVNLLSNVTNVLSITKVRIFHCPFVGAFSACC